MVTNTHKGSRNKKCLYVQFFLLFFNFLTLQTSFWIRRNIFRISSAEHQGHGVKVRVKVTQAYLNTHTWMVCLQLNERLFHQGAPCIGKQTSACASDLGDTSHVTCNEKTEIKYVSISRQVQHLLTLCAYINLIYLLTNPYLFNETLHCN